MMSPAEDPHVDVERCLSAIRELSGTLARDLRVLSPQAWDGPTNCPPWQVHQLAAHVVSSGEGFVDSIRSGLAGSLEPSVPPQERQRRQAALEASDSDAVGDALDAVTTEFVGLYGGLREDQLSAICFHRRGNRSVRWYAAHRLAEVAFHGWDLRLSLAQDPEFDDTVAGLLLPTLLESNAPRTYAAGLSAERGRGERYLLQVRDDPVLRWLVQIDPDRFDVLRDDAQADFKITASASDLALLVYGRADLPTLAESGRAQVKGETALKARFAQIFPRP
jgi:uncharacterized protein (TIGR03083 family)